jgi:hypothetical protein
MNRSISSHFFTEKENSSIAILYHSLHLSISLISSCISSFQHHLSCSPNPSPSISHSHTSRVFDEREEGVYFTSALGNSLFLCLFHCYRSLFALIPSTFYSSSSLLFSPPPSSSPTSSISSSSTLTPSNYSLFNGGKPPFSSFPILLSSDVPYVPPLSRHFMNSLHSFPHSSLQSLFGLLHRSLSLLSQLLAVVFTPFAVPRRKEAREKEEEEEEAESAKSEMVPLDLWGPFCTDGHIDVLLDLYCDLKHYGYFPLLLLSLSPYVLICSSFLIGIPALLYSHIRVYYGFSLLIFFQCIPFFLISFFCLSYAFYFQIFNIWSRGNSATKVVSKLFNRIAEKPFGSFYFLSLFLFNRCNFFLF